MFNISLKVKTVTPLCQIEGVNNNLVVVKRRAVLYNGEVVHVPIYSANGFRGLLRRLMGSILFTQATKKGIKFTVDDYQAVMSGGSAKFAKLTSIKMAEEENIRKLFPVISLLGTGLIIESKLIVSDLMPKIDKGAVIEGTKKVATKDGEKEVKYYFCPLVKTFTFTKKDDILDGSKFKALLSKKDIEEWEKTVSEQRDRNKESKNKAKETGTKAEKEKVGIKFIQEKEYIVPNTELFGSISSKQELTLVEKGLLLKGLTEITKEKLGSTKNLGFGVCDYQISLNDKLIIETEHNPENLFNTIIRNSFTEEADEAVEAADSWLDNLKPENVNIGKYLEQLM